MSGARRRAAPALVAAGLVLLTALCLGRIVGNGFVGMDDERYVSGNPHVLRGLSLEGAAWALTAREQANWHPLTWLSHQLDATLFGARPAGHHLVGLALHAANAALLFALLRGLCGGLWRPALAAALFALHPLHVESVAWAAERKDLLSTLFALLALAAWVRHLRRRGGGASAAAAALFAAALAAKPMPVTLPFLLLVLDWWPLGRWSPGGAGPPGTAGRGPASLLPPPRLWLEKAPLFLLAAGSAAVTYAVQAGYGTVASARAVPLATRLANAPLAYARYLVKALWPAQLTVYYPLEQQLPWWLWGGALAALALASLLAALWARRRPWLAAGWLWFLGTLVPVIGLVQAGGQALADRYTYFPLVGLGVALAWGAGEAARRRPAGARAVAGAAVAATAALGLLASRQAGFWRDGETLFRHALSVSPRSWVVLNNLGSSLAESGRLAEAERAYREAIAADPFRAQVHNNLGFVLFRQGRHGEAELSYRRALRIDPRQPLARRNLGTLLLERGRPDLALPELAAAAAADPSSALARLGLAGALLRLGRPREAIAPLREAARLAPGDANAQALLGEALAAAGEGAAADAAWRAALALDPAQPLARRRLGGR